MIIHAFAFRWKPDATAEHKERAASEIKAFQGQIPGLIETHVGENFSPRSQGHDLGAVMKFTDRDALEAYMVHPLHQELVNWLIAYVEPIEIDFEV
jgi:antibiotic biosynthesis monooxygenase (ABM) superfamily enzyme